jgi:hypothetical protein
MCQYENKLSKSKREEGGGDAKIKRGKDLRTKEAKDSELAFAVPS